MAYESINPGRLDEFMKRRNILEERKNLPLNRYLSSHWLYVHLHRRCSPPANWCSCTNSGGKYTEIVVVMLLVFVAWGYFFAISSRHLQRMLLNRFRYPAPTRRTCWTLIQFFSYMQKYLNITAVIIRLCICARTEFNYGDVSW